MVIPPEKCSSGIPTRPWNLSGAKVKEQPARTAPLPRAPDILGGETVSIPASSGRRSGDTGGNDLLGNSPFRKSQFHV